MNHAATAYFFHVNRFLNPSKIINMNNTETKTEYTSKYSKEAVKEHTNDLLSGGHPYLHMTPENEATYVQGYTKGLLRGMDIAIEILNKPNPSEAPTVFLQDEPKEEIKIELDEENKRTLHY